jgi:hypothetical protein
MWKQRYLSDYIKRVTELLNGEQDPTTEQIMDLILEMMQGGTTD